jgi:arylsulfatase A-like enzyme
VYTNDYPYGGWRAFHNNGDEDATIALALQKAGYRTGLFGKYFNHYPGGFVPPGWNTWASFPDTHNGGAYYKYSLYVKDAHGTRIEKYGSDRSDYSTTVIKNKAMTFLRSTSPTSPFFLYVAPFAPHGRIVPAPQDKGSYAGYRQALPKSFNERDVSDKPPYIRSLDPVKRKNVLEHFRLQYEALQSVDRMVDDIVRYLASTGRLHNTMIVFMSDNGINLGEHRWSEKVVPYEESIRVPFVVRYDPMTAPRAGSTSNAFVANVDLAPTFAALGGDPSYQGVGTVDGSSFVPLLDGSATSIRSNVLLEHLHYPKTTVPSYCGIRTAKRMYVRYSGGFEELYRLDSDPHELRNVAEHAPAEVAALRQITQTECNPPPPGYHW